MICDLVWTKSACHIYLLIWRITMNLKDNCRIAAYTRTPSPAYSIFLAESVHFALSLDGGSSYSPLNFGYGVLFPKCRFNEQNGIISAGVIDIEAAKVGKKYVITGKEILRRQVKNGIFMASFETSETGGFIRWETTDFIHFTQPERVANRLDDGEGVEEKGEKLSRNDEAAGISGGVSIRVSPEIAERLMLDDVKLKCSEVRVPKNIIAKCHGCIESVGAEIVYTDGSTHKKPVKWDCSGVDFSKPGVYTVSGKILRRHFPFPVERRPWGDPIITYYNGDYYFIGTDDWGGNKMFEIRKAAAPEALFAENVKKSVLISADTSEFDSTFWAPEFHIAGGKMRIFCTLGKGSFDPQSYVITLRDGGDMMNPADWSEPQRCVMPDGRNLGVNPFGDGKNGITLDMTYFEVNGKGYAAWSWRTWAGTDSGSMIMLASVDPQKPWQLLTYPTLMTRPEFGWENVDGTDNNEGPHPIVTDDKVYLAYSGGNAAGDTYVLGMMTADVRADLTDMSVWEKSLKPVLASNYVEGELGCGHNGFFVDELGDTYITYHGHKTLGNSDRIDGIRRVQFRADGRPYFALSEEDDLPAAMETVSMTVTVK